MFQPIAFAVALVVQPVPAGEAEPEETTEADTELQADAVEAQAQVEEPVICKRTSVVGSKFKKKVCGTPSEWAVMEGRSQDVTGQMQRRGKGMDPNGR